MAGDSQQFFSSIPGGLKSILAGRSNQTTDLKLHARKMFDNPVPASLKNTFSFMYYSLKKGVYVRIIAGKLDAFVPFSNANFYNKYEQSRERSSQRQFFDGQKMQSDDKDFGEFDRVEDFLKGLLASHGRDIPDIEFFVNVLEGPVAYEDHLAFPHLYKNPAHKHPSPLLPIFSCRTDASASDYGIAIKTMGPKFSEKRDGIATMIEMGESERVERVQSLEELAKFKYIVVDFNSDDWVNFAALDSVILAHGSIPDGVPTEELGINQFTLNFKELSKLFPSKQRHDAIKEYFTKYLKAIAVGKAVRYGRYTAHENQYFHQLRRELDRPEFDGPEYIQPYAWPDYILNDRSFGILKGMEMCIQQLIRTIDFDLANAEVILERENDSMKVYKFDLMGKNLAIKATSDDEKVMEYAHDAFMGRNVVLPLLRDVENFVATFGAFRHENATCVITEFVDNAVALMDYIQSPEFSISEFLNVLLQVACCIEVAQRRCNYMHLSLKPWDIMVQKVEEPVDLYYPVMDIKNNVKIIELKRCKYVAKILDYGRCSGVFEGRMYASPRVFNNRMVFNKTADLYMLVMSSLRILFKTTIKRADIDPILLLCRIMSRDPKISTLKLAKDFVYNSMVPRTDVVVDNLHLLPDLSIGRFIEECRPLFSIARVFYKSSFESKMVKHNAKHIYDFFFSQTDADLLKADQTVSTRVLWNGLPGTENAVTACVAYYLLKGASEGYQDFRHVKKILDINYMPLVSGKMAGTRNRAENLAMKLVLSKPINNRDKAKIYMDREWLKFDAPKGIEDPDFYNQDVSSVRDNVTPIVETVQLALSLDIFGDEQKKYYSKVPLVKDSARLKNLRWAYAVVNSYNWFK